MDITLCSPARNIVQIKQPTFKASNDIEKAKFSGSEQECLLALRKGLIHAEDSAIDEKYPSGDKVPFFHYLVKQDYTNAVGYLLANAGRINPYD